MTLLLAALGAFFVVEFVKVVLAMFDHALHPWLKALLALAEAMVIVGAYAGWDWRVIPVGLAAAGLAGLVHKTHRALSAVGDAQQMAVLSRATTRVPRI